MQTSKHVSHFYGVAPLIITHGGNNLAQLSKSVVPFHATLVVASTYSNDVTTIVVVVARKFTKIVKRKSLNKLKRLPKFKKKKKKNPSKPKFDREATRN